MTWTYYLQDYGEGAWILFREAPDREDESYRRGDGWHPTHLLYERLNKGDIDDENIVTEAEADALVATFPPAPPTPA